MVAPTLLPTTSGSAAWFVDYPMADPPGGSDLVKLTSRLTPVVTAELTAAGDLRADTVRILLAALSRAVAKTMGAGSLTVRVDAEGGAQYTVVAECLAGGGHRADDLLAAIRPAASAAADVVVSYRSTVAGTSPQAEYLLALHARMGADVLYLDWWYDSRCFDECTVEELAGQFPLALIEVTSG